MLGLGIFKSIKNKLILFLLAFLYLTTFNSTLWAYERSFSEGFQGSAWTDPNNYYNSSGVLKSGTAGWYSQWYKGTDNRDWIEFMRYSSQSSLYNRFVEVEAESSAFLYRTNVCLINGERLTVSFNHAPRNEGAMPTADVVSAVIFPQTVRFMIRSADRTLSQTIVFDTIYQNYSTFWKSVSGSATFNLPTGVYDVGVEGLAPDLSYGNFVTNISFAPNATVDGVSCAATNCPSGFTLLAGKCIPDCPSGSSGTHPGCSCTTGTYHPWTNQCVTCPSGTTGTSPGQQGGCVCPSNQTYDFQTNTCVRSYCPLDTSSGTYNTDPNFASWSCTCNTPGYTYNSTLSLCVPSSCPSGATGSTPGTPTGCSCGTNQHYNATANSCDTCPASTPKWNSSANQCEACPSSTPSWNSNTGQCEACPSSTPYWNTTNNQCETCPSSIPKWNSNTGQCEACPSTTPNWNPLTNQCDYAPCPTTNGTGGTNPGQPGGCGCSSGYYYYFQNNTCAALPSCPGLAAHGLANTSPNPLQPNGCNCDTGYYYNFTNNSCDANNCTAPTVGTIPYCYCASGSLDTTTCKGSCPTGSKWNANTQTCSAACRSAIRSSRTI